MKHDLIHSFLHRLDVGELRMCERFYGQPKGESMRNRKLLFEALLHQREYDRSALLQAMGVKWTKERLAQEKHKLYEDLIEVVGRLHRERDGRQCPWTQWQDARTLMRMGLMDAAADTARQGLERAMHLEELHAEMQLRELLREILKSTDRKAAQPEIMDNDQRLDTAVDKVRALTSYSLTADRLLDYYQRFRTIDPDKLPVAIATLLQAQMVTDINKATSLPALLRFHHIKVLQARMEGRVEEAITHYWEIIRLWESHPQCIDQRPHLYRKALANLTGALIVLGSHKEVEMLLARMENIPVIFQRDRALQFCDVELQYQLFNLNTGRLDAALKRKDLLPKGLKDHGRNIADGYQMVLRYNAGVMYMMNDEPRAAKKLFNEIRELKHITECRDLQGLARLFRLLLLMMDNEADFDSYMRNSRPFFADTHRQYPLEQMVYAWIGAHCKLTSEAHVRSSFAQLTAKVLPFEKEKMTGAEELRIWAQAHANGQPVREVYLAHHAGALASPQPA